jgi:hypothetical protein
LSVVAMLHRTRPLHPSTASPDGIPRRYPFAVSIGGIH